MVQKLREVGIRILPTGLCEASYGGVSDDKMICAGVVSGGKDACQVFQRCIIAID